MSESYDPDTTRLFDEDPDLVRLRRHLDFTGTIVDIGSPIGAWLQKNRNFGGLESDEDKFSMGFVNEENELNIPLLHSKA
jgi:hypothetical protein